MLRTRWLYLRLLGAIMLLAFISLWVQIQGLSGPTGVLPAEQYLDGVRASLTSGGSFAWWRAPTLGWLGAGETALDLMCAGGAIVSALLMFNLLPQVSLLVGWVLYASLINLSGSFMSYQWDVLLAEVALLSLLWAPMGLRPGLGGKIPKLAPWVLRVALFKLMFSSGMVKLVNLDEAWVGLQATTLHYWTQPLPHRVAWYAHQLPSWFHQASVAITLIIELVVPLLLFAPRKLRVWAFVPLVGLQIIFAATGNYGFFNLLVLTLCLVIIDDKALAKIMPGKVKAKWFPKPKEAPKAEAAPAPKPEEGKKAKKKKKPKKPKVPTKEKMKQGLGHGAAVAAVLVMLLYVPHSVGKILEASRMELPGWAQTVDGYVRPWRMASGPYGLFAQVVSERVEISIEGSADGRTWKPYVFKYKPGDLKTAPAFTGFHMPRLDWHMWAPSLGSDCRQDRRRSSKPYWLDGLMRGLASNDAEVLSLFEKNPFPRTPPRQLRARRWKYTFAGEKAQEKGVWWARTSDGMWCAPRTSASLLRGRRVAGEMPGQDLATAPVDTEPVLAPFSAIPLEDVPASYAPLAERPVSEAER
ncbi:MAG: lipase maturation factor family protein [Bradymonadia bacterium]